MPPDFKAGEYEYKATAMYFGATGNLSPGDSASGEVDLSLPPAKRLTIGFTRGYLSSQAYRDKFQNAPIGPTRKSIDYDTSPYQDQYRWLGFHAHQLIGSFLDECLADSAILVDAFAYDLNDPDTIARMVSLGQRLRLYLDDASLHVSHSPPGRPIHPLEDDAAVAIAQSGATVKRGHFRRFAHSKVLIARRGGTAIRVLTGSTNFSVRGLFVQANNVLVFDSEPVAQLYARAFDIAWTAPQSFATSDIARDWFPLPADGLSTGAVAFSPHTAGDVALGRVAHAISGAKTSLLFSVMGLSGGGDVLKQLRLGTTKPGLFSYGITQSRSSMRLYRPGSATPVVVPYAYLKAKVPWPFRAEISGGAGQVIHDKFVVVDFTGADPTAYTGSSNLAAGGEHDNGDNLIELRGRAVASLYAVDALRQIDHFHFRAAMQGATEAEPLVLKGAKDWHLWVDPYYNPTDLKYLDRQLFARAPG